MTKKTPSIVRRQSPPGSVSTPVVTPIYPSVAYDSGDPDQLDAQYDGSVAGYTYAREGHPNATIVGQKIDWLEGLAENAGVGTVTGSGMSAVGALFLGLLESGDHVLAGNQLYGRSLRLLTRDLPRMGMSATLTDPTDADAFLRALRPETKLILLEVVSNPTLRIADIERIARGAQEHGVLLAVDNTFTTPRAYRPFDHGANVVIHSLTKMLAGHTDATLGWIAADTQERNRSIYDACVTWGLTASPFDCWLAERGLNTFELRFDRAQDNAVQLADALADMDGVQRVLYPGRSDHPDYERAQRLLGGRFGNMVSFCLKDDRDTANAFFRAAGNIAFAPTLGDVGTTFSHAASSSHRGLSVDERAALGISEGFVRVSVGCEDIELLIREIRDALATVT
ncbi:MAG: PLP-dependent aspartate aminotransferase family protein [Gammaproteobacteria bacterium]